MLRTILTAMLVSFYLLSPAQDTIKPSFAIAPLFEAEHNKNTAEYGEKLLKAIVYYSDSIYKRFTVVPTDKWGMARDAGESLYIDKAKSLGITYLITGVIHSVTTYQDSAKEKSGNIVSFFNSDLIFSVKIIETQTGEIFNSDTIDTHSRRDFNVSLQPKSTLTLSPQSAIDAAIHKVGFWVFRGIAKTFPDIITVLKVLAKDDKGGALLIRISAGSESSLFKYKMPTQNGKRKQLKIVQYGTETVDGKVMRKTIQIGLAQLDKVDDANFSDWLVTDGRREITKKVDAGEKLFLITAN